MPKLGCAHCRPPAERRRLDALAAELDRKGGNTAPPRDVKVRAWTKTTARYPGRCVMDCGHLIVEGDEVIKVAGYRWAHLDCTQTT